MYIDTHAHLTSSRFTNQSVAIVDRATAAQVTTILTMGTDLHDSRKAISVAQHFPRVFAAAGIHPENLDHLSETWRTDLATMLHLDKVVAVGEIGLDYVNGSPDHALQQNILIEQIKLARELNLPVILHCREAFDDLFKLIQPFAPLMGVMHSFTGNAAQARETIADGLHLGLNGIVTFSNAKELQEVTKGIPLTRIVLETDCPYLAPQPVRGKLNEPQYIPMIATKIAELLEIPVAKVAEQTTANASTLFNLPQFE